ncbi:uncharacterized protein A1O9_08499 [Exophiala aquamarina CBS 119918]|uniref:Uncharacterized protein n=1 Tax=Exophiala aquamarina CBS 119918 TaxID=1182545 RepID=A0A072P905_9EURO|nr:uncharacterized protein A1O9_08499 [Exophiala aquamarina CBS 119918]KEF55748.1 hypothetical protein A1O9_08499 [Exophiala aquamarina CBS 119918]
MYSAPRTPGAPARIFGPAITVEMVEVSNTTAVSRAALRGQQRRWRCHVYQAATRAVLGVLGRPDEYAGEVSRREGRGCRWPDQGRR